MALRIDERDLSAMPEKLRNELMLWYVERQELKLSDEIAEDFKNFIDEPVESDVPLKFSEFIEAGVLDDGDAIVCKAMRRDQTKVNGGYIRGAVVDPDGLARFNGRDYETPSQLAVAMARSVAPKGKVRALNGYKYLFREYDGSLVSLDELRRRALGRRRFAEAQERALRLIMASGKPLFQCPHCSKEQREEKRQAIKTDGDELTLVTLLCGHTIVNKGNASDGRSTGQGIEGTRSPRRTSSRSSRAKR
jgi:hypothetical protein